MANYPAAYQSTSGSALDVDRDFYKALAEGPRELITSHLIPIRTGFAWEVPAGHLFRITTPEGPQVGDLNIWNRKNVGIPYPPITTGAPVDLRSTLVEFAVYSSDSDHHRRFAGGLWYRQRRRPRT